MGVDTVQRTKVGKLSAMTDLYQPQELIKGDKMLTVGAVTEFVSSDPESEGIESTPM